MAQISLTPSEMQQIEKIAGELDHEIEDFFSDARVDLSDEGWALLTTYARACVRRALEVGSLLHGVVDGHSARRRPYPGRGREVFVKSALVAWRDSFAPIPEIWKLGPVLESVTGGEKRVVADVETLEVMAANRMFASLDDQCASLLGSSG